MSRLLIPVALLVALVGINTLTRHVRDRQPAPAPSSARSAWLASPYTLDPFTVKDLEGRELSSAAWAGQVAVINFWATWCLPCRREIPALVALQERYKGRAIVVGVIDDNAGDDVIRRFAANLQINYPIVRTSLELTRRFPSVEALPMTVLVDPRGRVSVAYAGEVNAAELEQDLLKLLAISTRAAAPQG